MLKMPKNKTKNLLFSSKKKKLENCFWELISMFTTGKKSTLRAIYFQFYENRKNALQETDVVSALLSISLVRKPDSIHKII